MEKYQELLQAEEAISSQIEEISEFIYQHPELGMQEFVSSKYLCDQLEDAGFEVTYPYLGIETAFRAELKCSEGPKVCLLTRI